MKTELLGKYDDFENDRRPIRYAAYINKLDEVFNDMFSQFGIFSESLSNIQLEIQLYREEMELSDDFLGKEYDLIDDIIDFSISKEIFNIEKAYYGETYAQFYKDYAGVKNVCLQNDWAGKIRKRCETYDVTVGGSKLKGCIYPHRNKPNNCVLRYNYERHLCEPSAAYCRGYGLDKVITTPANKKFELEFADTGKKLKVDGGNLKNCSDTAPSFIFEFVIGTTLTRFAKKLICRVEDECCQNADCVDKFGEERPLCAHKRCIPKYGHNEPKGAGVCNALEEPTLAWTKRNVPSPECKRSFL